MLVPTNNIALQNAWVVTDIEHSARHWSKALNIGPFYVAEYTDAMFDNVEYRGAPGKLHMKTAIAYAGEVQIELIEPVGEYPCAYFDTVKPGTTAFHHLCYWSDDFDADMAHYSEMGYATVNQGQMAGGGARFSYLDASASLGHMIELLERAEGTERLFNKWKENAKAWKPGDEAIINL